MKFEDLTEFDLSLIKEKATKLIVQTSKTRHHALVIAVSECIHNNGYDLFFGSQSDILNRIESEITPSPGYRSAIPDLGATDTIHLIFQVISSFGVDIVKSDRQPTWPKPGSHWHAPAVNTKKSWVY